MTAIDDTSTEIVAGPPLEWEIPSCPICRAPVEEYVTDLYFRCDECGLWWHRDGRTGGSTSTPCRQQETSGGLPCIRRVAHHGPHAAYQDGALVRWERSPMEQVADLLRCRYLWEISDAEFQDGIEKIVRSEGLLW